MPATIENKRVQAVFEKHADAYDAWYDKLRGQRLFRTEVACLKAVLNPEMPRPWLEVGVGTGRFAVALGIEQGVDCAAAPLRMAEARGVCVSQGMAESLPYDDGLFGAVFMIVTLCFVDDPLMTVREAARVLRPGGSLVVGFVPGDSAWGQAYLKQASEGHIFYTIASFFAVDDVRRFAGKAGLSETGVAGCMQEAPEQDVDHYAPPRSGVTNGMGFVAMRFTKGFASATDAIDTRKAEVTR